MGTEALVRVGFFLGVLAILAVWELRAPRRSLTTPKPTRWLSNLGIVLINTSLLHVTLPVTATGMAILAGERTWGLLNFYSARPWLAILLGVVVMDLVIYLQHVTFHAIPILWRFHMVHHTDRDFDVTTGVRFHPAEIITSLGIKLGAIVLLGPPATAVLIFQVLLNATSMFNHGNVRIPTGVDRILRLFVVTPDMHRVHHSVLIRETNSNYGFNLPWWDRLLGTYRDQPAAGHEGMTIGLAHFREAKYASLPWVLAMPFIRRSS